MKKRAKREESERRRAEGERRGKRRKQEKMEKMRRSPTGHSVFNGFNYLTSICEVSLNLRAQSIQH